MNVNASAYLRGKGCGAQIHSVQYYVNAYISDITENKYKSWRINFFKFISKCYILLLVRVKIFSSALISFYSLLGIHLLIFVFKDFLNLEWLWKLQRNKTVYDFVVRSRCSVARVYDYGRCNKWVTVGLKETRFAQMGMAAIKKVVR